MIFKYLLNFQEQKRATEAAPFQNINKKINLPPS